MCRLQVCCLVLATFACLLARQFAVCRFARLLPCLAAYAAANLDDAPGLAGFLHFSLGIRPLVRPVGCLSQSPMHAVPRARPCLVTPDSALDGKRLTPSTAIVGSSSSSYSTLAGY